MKTSIWRILFFLFVLIGITGLLFIFSITVFFYKFNIESTIESKKTELELISNALSGPSWTVKQLYPGTTENILRGVMDMPGSVFIRIVNNNREIEQSANPKEKGMKIVDLPAFERTVKVRDGVYDNKPIKEFSIMSRDGSYIWLGVSFENIKNSILYSSNWFGIITLLLLSITVIIVYLLVKAVMIRPLLLLINAFEKLKGGDYKVKLNSNISTIEMHKVFRSFNKTVERIENTESKLADELKRAKEIDRLKSEFISTAAHQLRTPLSAVKWTLKMLVDGDFGTLNSEQKTFLMQGYQSNERMIDLVNDLLDVARIEEGRFGFNFSFIQLEDLIDNIVQDFTHRIEEKKIKFKFIKPDEKLPKVRVDPSRIRLVIQNLIDNAIKYTPEVGEVTVLIKYSKLNIEFSVKDSGIGIPANQINRLFTKFFRSDNALKMQTEGSGLGLFIVKNIVEKHGGKIWVESKENKGSTFAFSLPVQLIS